MEEQVVSNRPGANWIKEISIKDIRCRAIAALEKFQKILNNTPLILIRYNQRLSIQKKYILSNQELELIVNLANNYSIEGDETYQMKMVGFLCQIDNYTNHNNSKSYYCIEDVENFKKLISKNYKNGFAKKKCNAEDFEYSEENALD